MIIGSHVGFNKKEQLLGSVKEALSYNATTFMFYTGAPQNTTRLPIDDNLTKQAFNLMEKNNINPQNVIIHAPYIINLANEKNFDFSISFLKQEIKRVEQLGFDKIVLHPGSHVGIGTEQAIDNIAYCLNQSLEKTNVKILLETMAGKGTEVGITFEEIKKIIDKTQNKNNIGVCLDTCHINDAGYDLNNFDKILNQFDKIIGLDKLLCIHVNDSKNQIHSHKDRHENIGYGYIGFNNLINVVYNEKLKEIPKILETPYIKDNDKTYPPYKFEIEMIKNKEFNNNLIESVINYYK